MLIAILVISIIAIVLSLFSMAIGIWAAIELRSFMKSTHQVQWMPADKAMSDQQLNEIFRNPQQSKDYIDEELDNVI